MNAHLMPKKGGIGATVSSPWRPTAQKVCIESMIRFAIELDYGVTMITDSAASFSKEEMSAVFEVNLTN